MTAAATAANAPRDRLVPMGHRGGQKNLVRNLHKASIHYFESFHHVENKQVASATGTRFVDGAIPELYNYRKQVGSIVGVQSVSRKLVISLLRPVGAAGQTSLQPAVNCVAKQRPQHHNSQGTGPHFQEQRSPRGPQGMSSGAMAFRCRVQKRFTKHHQYARRVSPPTGTIFCQTPNNIFSNISWKIDHCTTNKYSTSTV